jgi:integrase
MQPLSAFAVEYFLMLKETVKSECIENEKVFPNFTKSCKPAAWIKKDLISAGLKAKDSEGNAIDFHSLRVSYISFLANSATPAKTIQTLARHSTPQLTFNVYAKSFNETKQLAMDSLPVFDENCLCPQLVFLGENSAKYGQWRTVQGTDGDILKVPFLVKILHL